MSNKPKGKEKNVNAKNNKQQDQENEESSQPDQYEEIDEEEEEEKIQQNKEQFTLYDLLHVSKTATQQEIKKAYRQLALEVHPDKNRDDSQATEKFQKIVQAYQILTNPEKRKIYDETGSYGDDFNSAEFKAAYEYFRAIYKKIETSDIDNFAVKYRNSKEEESDLINYYNEMKGDLTEILENIILSRNEDIERYIQTYERLIEQKVIKKYKAFDQTKNSIQLLPDEEEEVLKDKKKQNDDIQDLANQIIARRQIQATDMLKLLEMKYCDKNQKKSSGQKLGKSGKSKKSKLIKENELNESGSQIDQQQQKKLKK